MSPNNEKTPPAGRIEWLDGARGAAVLLMLGWHFLWDMTTFGFLPVGVMRSVPATLLRYLGGCAFVWIAGVSCRLTRSNLRRGAVTLLCAAAVTLATAAVGTPVWFGVLHLLGLSMLLYAAVGKKLEALPETPYMGACLVLFAAFLIVSESVRVSVPGLWLFGLRTEKFVSADYFPLFPWLFLFLAGAAAGRSIRENAGKRRGMSWSRPLLWLGRHSLVIYLAHQPLIYLVLTLCGALA